MKSYDETTNNLLERREQYIAKQSKKRKRIVRITSVACSFVLVALIGLSIWQPAWLEQMTPLTTNNPGISGEKQPSNDELPGNKAYPYDDRIQYLPKEMPVSKYENGFFAYNQIKDIDTNIVNMYAVLYDNSELHRDCFPVFASDGSVSFSRKTYSSDTDEKRYAETKVYLGEDNNLFYILSSLPQNTNNGVSCLLMQNGKNSTTTAVSAEVGIYENCTLNVIVSNDFNSVENDMVKKHINKMRELTNSDTVSIMEDKEFAISYVYQTRFCEEKNVDEEHYVYYAFFERNGKEYLVQFTSNYTVAESDKNAYGVPGRSQDECKTVFEEIIQHLLLNVVKTS